MNNDKGIALLLVLSVITLLTVICAEFSWTMRTETVITRNFRDGEQAAYCAEAGINKAIVELPLNGRNYLGLVNLAPNINSLAPSSGQAGSRQGGNRAGQAIAAGGNRVV